MAAPLGVIAPEQGRRHRFGGPQAVDMWAGSILRPERQFNGQDRLRQRGSTARRARLEGTGCFLRLFTVLFPFSCRAAPGRPDGCAACAPLQVLPWRKTEEVLQKKTHERTNPMISPGA